jgi:hypothetical protein
MKTQKTFSKPPEREDENQKQNKRAREVTETKKFYASRMKNPRK